MFLLLNPSFLPQTSSYLNPSPRISRLHHGSRCLCQKESYNSSNRNRGIEEEEAREGFRREATRRWWSDNKDYDFNDDYDYVVDDDDDDLFDDRDEESIWDKIWILKVFKSYGYFLPVIIGSTLLATGPTAFLLALALPLGQSAISFAINYFWGNKARQKARYKPRRRPFSRYNEQEGSNYKSNSYGRRRYNGEEGNNYKSNGYRRNGSYQSWVSMDQGDTYDKGCRKSGFGGWDELDRERDNSVKGGVNGETGTKLSKRGRRYNKVPFFMRLLVAVFPFLGSWFRIL